MSHESPTINDTCIYRVTHAACGWQILTHDWQLLADDHYKDCEWEDDEAEYDFRVNCLMHNPDDDESKAHLVVGRD